MKGHMNIIDFGIIGVLLLFMAIGYYRGFLVSVVDSLCGILSSLAAWALYVPVARALNAGDGICSVLVGFSESADIIGSVELYNTGVSSLVGAGAQEFADALVLPGALKNVYVSNLQNARFAPLGLNTAGDYLGRTMAEHAVNVMAFILVFALALAILMVAVRLADYTIKFPALKFGDGLSGALVGFVQGAVVLFVLMCAIPVAQAFLPFDELRMLVDESQFSQLFYQSNMFLRVIRGFI